VPVLRADDGGTNGGRVNEFTLRVPKYRCRAGHVQAEVIRFALGGAGDGLYHIGEPPPQFVCAVCWRDWMVEMFGSAVEDE